MKSLEAGTLLDKYEIVRPVDSGGMCLVYEARRSGESKSVAIKVLHEVWAKDSEISGRFANEAHSLARMRHPNIVSGYGHGSLHSGEPYMVLEWAPYSLQDIFDNQQSGFDAAVAVRLAKQVAEALVYLHAQNIVHRDIKAANVLIDDDDLSKGNVRLADLGLAKVAPERRSAAGMNVSTGGRARFGTWDYMAPEQWIRSKDVDPKTDVYSLGVLMFQMISGHLPFVADDAKGLMRMHLFVEAPVGRLRGKCARPLVQLIDRMLRKTLKERSSMNEVVQRLEMMAPEKS